ncbi:MAG: response regulator [Alphaproteobacteria bacterium]|nr:response regulator [Alphaproteobacteria bacterium]
MIVVDVNFEKLKFMIVEDNFEIRRHIHQILKDNKARKIVTVNSEEEAVWRMEIMLPDVLIVGWNLSSVDGVDFTKTLRTSSDSPSKYLPIILIASLAYAKDVKKARDAGASEILAVPFSAKSLYSRICSVIEKPRSFISSKKYIGPDRRRKLGDFTGSNRRKGKKGLNEKDIDKLLGKFSS